MTVSYQVQCTWYDTLYYELLYANILEEKKVVKGSIVNPCLSTFEYGVNYGGCNEKDHYNGDTK